MGVLSVVIPLLPEEKDEIRVWLHSLGMACPEGEGRYPSIAELRSVLERLEGYTIHYTVGASHWSADVAQRDQVNDDWAALVVKDYSGNDADSHAFCFERGAPPLMLLIVHRLASICGPQLLLPDTGAPPFIVTPELDLYQALREWDS
jgi:hypothetical protein